jgi:cytoskeletal protein CcmA (bactofilin family)
MDAHKRGNITMSGIGSSSGGNVRIVKIDGIGKLDGDVICSEFIVNGKADIYGSVKASTADINGTAVVQGNLHSERVRTQGKAIVNGDLIGDHIDLTGLLSVAGKCEAERFNANGKLQMKMLNAGNIQITLHGNSSIAEIGGERIKIRREPGIDFAKWLKVLPIPLGNKLTAQTIEGDDVYVEYTTAEVVRGSNVAIGPGCEIGLVEYKTKFDHDKASKIKRIQQM